MKEITDLSTLPKKYRMSDSDRATLPDYDQLISMPQLCKMMHVTMPTAHRWCGDGVRGEVLRSWIIGGRRFTTPEAIDEFIIALNESDDDKLKKEGC